MKGVKARPQEVDRHVGARIRGRRVMLGMTQKQAAALIGVTWQQVWKYEKGTNRIAAGRLYRIAQALNVEPAYFFEGVGDGSPPSTDRRQRLLLELARSFLNITAREHREAVLKLSRVLSAEQEAAP